MLNEHLNVNHSYWIRILSIAFIINIVITLAGGMMFWAMHQHFETNTHVNMTLTENDHLLLYDKIMTNSALLYARTGNLHYKQEYEKSRTDLTNAITGTQQLLQNISEIIKARQEKWFWLANVANLDTAQIINALAMIEHINSVNDEIVKIEQRSFNLVAENNFSAANALLEGHEYANLEATLRDNTSRTIKTAKEVIAKDDYEVSLQTSTMITIVTSNAIILVLTWFFSIRAIQRWKNEQLLYEVNLYEIQAQLEQRVETRTQELLQANEQLSQFNLTLENRVAERTHELLKANLDFQELNASLENRVQERTAKLQEMNDEFLVLNETLAQTIEEEVKSSREKDVLLLQQSRLAVMGEMMGNIAHQWRQPINALNLVLINIEDAYRFNDLTEEYLHQQVEKGDRLVKAMSNTIDDFRNFFKSDGNQEMFDIEKAIHDTLSILEASFKNNDIKVEIVAPKKVSLLGIEGQYKQVLLNIFSNAKDALIERGISNAKIVIELTEENGLASVRIRDNAGGIKDDVIEKVFDPYFTTRPQGNGIGLYMSKMIIENNMHGKLSVKNVGGGAEFCIKTNMNREILPPQMLNG
jgi:C4-dicarboxylate-specific signal transduction histidine kinase